MGINASERESGLLEALRHNAGWVVGIGVFLLVIGVLAVASPLVAGAAIMTIVGSILLVGGAGQCLLAFRAGASGRGIFILLGGLLTLIAGGYMIMQPLAALASITFFIAID